MRDPGELRNGRLRRGRNRASRQARAGERPDRRGDDRKRRSNRARMRVALAGQPRAPGPHSEVLPLPRSPTARRPRRGGAARGLCAGSDARGHGPAEAWPRAARSSPAPGSGPTRLRPTLCRPRTRGGPSGARRERSRTTRCRCAGPPAFPAPARGSCKRPSREPRPAACRRRSRWANGRGRVGRDSGANALARPKSRTFTFPAGVTLMLAGLRSRWTMPFSCAASSASAIWRPRASVSSTGTGPRRDALGQRLAFDELEHEEPRAARLLEAVDRGDRGMVERGEHTGLPVEPREPFGIGRESGGEHLDGHLAMEPRVASAIHLAHAARTERGKDLVEAETRAGRKAHRPPVRGRILSPGQAEAGPARRRRRSASA